MEGTLVSHIYTLTLPLIPDLYDYVRKRESEGVLIWACNSDEILVLGGMVQALLVGGGDCVVCPR